MASYWYIARASEIAGLFAEIGPYARTFGAANLEPIAQSQGTAYRVSGMFGLWMQRRFSERDYRFVGAEFGTYGVLRVLAALRAENRAHYYCAANDTAYARAKLELRDLAMRFDSRGEAARAFAVRELPVTILIDRQGRELGRLSGPAAWDGDAAKALLKAALVE